MPIARLPTSMIGCRDPGAGHLRPLAHCAEIDAQTAAALIAPAPDDLFEAYPVSTDVIASPTTMQSFWSRSHRAP